MHPDVLGIFRRNLETALVHSLLGCRKGEMNEPTHLARFFLFNEIVRVELFHLGREPHRMTCQIKGSNRGHTALTRQQTSPDLRGIVSHTANQTDSGYNNSTMR